jgi:hypothetical protein
MPVFKGVDDDQMKAIMAHGTRKQFVQSELSTLNPGKTYPLTETPPKGKISPWQTKKISQG